VVGSILSFIGVLPARIAGALDAIVKLIGGNR